MSLRSHFRKRLGCSSIPYLTKVEEGDLVVLVKSSLLSVIEQVQDLVEQKFEGNPPSFQGMKIIVKQSPGFGRLPEILE